tara:strand:+ start:92 stop:244 length:153 start_codon:yes stop_codon:yes gene_type:complete
MIKTDKILKSKIIKPRFKIKATQVHKVKSKYTRKIKHKINLTNLLRGYNE